MGNDPHILDDRKDREILTIDRLPIKGLMGRNGSVVICFDYRWSDIINIVNGHIDLVKGRYRNDPVKCVSKKFHE